MLVTHGERDFRVPVGEALRLWTDLRRHGVEARFLYFPDENHWVLKPAQLAALVRDGAQLPRRARARQGLGPARAAVAAAARASTGSGGLGRVCARPRNAPALVPGRTSTARDAAPDRVSNPIRYQPRPPVADLRGPREKIGVGPGTAVGRLLGFRQSSGLSSGLGCGPRGAAVGRGRAREADEITHEPMGVEMTARQTAIEAIAGRKTASTQNYLEHAGEDIYGQYVFGEDAQREYLAKPVYKKLRRTIEGLEPFDPAIADAVAQGVKQWAVAHGATHYTHWFVPLTGASAEKHDSFLSPAGDAPDHRRVLRQGPDPGRARRVVASRRAASAPPSRRAATPPGT